MAHLCLGLQPSSQQISRLQMEGASMTWGKSGLFSSACKVSSIDTQPYFRMCIPSVSLHFWWSFQDRQWLCSHRKHLAGKSTLCHKTLTEERKGYGRLATIHRTNNWTAIRRTFSTPKSNPTTWWPHWKFHNLQTHSQQWTWTKMRLD
jgi:hypothetical protein